MASGSKRVEHAIAVFFGRFQSIAEVQELIMRWTTFHLIDGPAHVSDQVFEFKAVRGNDFDVTTCRTGLERLFDLFERIA